MAEDAGVSEKARGLYEDTLFGGMKFWVSKRVPLHHYIVGKIDDHGGKIVLLEKHADVLIADHAFPNRAPPGSVSWTFINECVEKEELVNIEKHRIHKVAEKAPVKGVRTAFTAQDDATLVGWVQRKEREGASISGNVIYRELSIHCPQHTWQSWRSRWVDNLSHLPKDRLPRGRDLPVSPEQTKTLPDPTPRIPQTQPARIGSQKGRVPFTPEDDDILMQFVGGHVQAGRKDKGNAIYKLLEEEHPHHTYQSWRDRWVKYVSPRFYANYDPDHIEQISPGPPPLKKERRALPPPAVATPINRPFKIEPRAAPPPAHSAPASRRPSISHTPFVQSRPSPTTSFQSHPTPVPRTRESTAAPAQPSASQANPNLDKLKQMRAKRLQMTQSQTSQGTPVPPTPQQPKVPTPVAIPEQRRRRSSVLSAHQVTQTSTSSAKQHDSDERCVKNEFISKIQPLAKGFLVRQSVTSKLEEQRGHEDEGLFVGDSEVGADDVAETMEGSESEASFHEQVDRALKDAYKEVFGSQLQSPAEKSTPRNNIPIHQRDPAEETEEELDEVPYEQLIKEERREIGLERSRRRTAEKSQQPKEAAQDSEEEEEYARSERLDWGNNELTIEEEVEQELPSEPKAIRTTSASHGTKPTAAPKPAAAPETITIPGEEDSSGVDENWHPFWPIFKEIASQKLEEEIETPPDWIAPVSSHRRQVPAAEIWECVQANGVLALSDKKWEAYARQLGFTTLTMGGMMLVIRSLREYFERYLLDFWLAFDGFQKILGRTVGEKRRRGSNAGSGEDYEWAEQGEKRRRLGV
ncbi:hypothetical protein QBC35DRAFT_402579 [Podospora australis]|uniref:DNA-binding protein RAP1 n=1 Tax=Podospora australis TaxID=1536484 RepID=A0AAN6WYS7_9PEZI|nr:hypothetical protein QBC35DRAFT_402579 [Podospora australis]